METKTFAFLIFLPTFRFRGGMGILPQQMFGGPAPNVGGIDHSIPAFPIPIGGQPNPGYPMPVGNAPPTRMMLGHGTIHPAAPTMGPGGPAYRASDLPPQSKPVRKSVLKDKDGNLVSPATISSNVSNGDGAIIRSSTAPQPVAPPVITQRAPIARVSNNVTQSGDLVIKAPLAEEAASLLTNAASVRNSGGDEDLVIKAPDEAAAALFVVSSNAYGAANTSHNVSDSRAIGVRVGEDADYILRVPQFAVVNPPVEVAEQPVPNTVVTTLEASSVKTNVVEAPEPAMSAEDEEDDWENSEVVDVLKQHVAAANAPRMSEPEPAVTSSTEFVFPKPSSSGVDVKRNKKNNKKDKYASADAAYADAVGNEGLLDAYASPVPPSSSELPPASGKQISAAGKSFSPPSSTAAKSSSKQSSNVKASVSKVSPPVVKPASSSTVSQVVSTVPLSATSASPTPVGAGKTTPIIPQAAASSPDVSERAHSSSIDIIAPDDDSEWDRAGLASTNQSSLVTPVASPAVSAPIVPAARRSLRPGGGTAPREALNVGGLRSQADRPRVIYTKKELFSFKPNPLTDRPAVLMSYDQITIYDSGSGVRTVKGLGMGSLVSTSLGGVGISGPRSSSSADKWAKTSFPLPPEDRASNSPYSQQFDRRSGKKSKAAATPMPKKVINDPTEKYSRQVQEILNKISPLNFQKLMVDLVNIPCESFKMMERLVYLIFEKALQEPNFGKLYADLCSFIEEQSPRVLSNFFYVVYDEAAVQHRWVQGLEMPLEFAGPFSSEAESLNAFSGQKMPSLQAVTIGQLVHVSLTHRSDLLIQVAKLENARSDCYFATYKIFKEVEQSAMSEKATPSAEGAVKDYAKKHGFRRTLIANCQQEFIDSVIQEPGGKYDSCAQRVLQFESKTNFENEEERQNELAEIEELQFKMKRRMLGNIRFIGELFKAGLLKEDIIFQCLDLLMLDGDSWRVMDERSIEILCKLLTTVGGDVKNQGRLNNYFDHLDEMVARDKSLNSRLRFTIIEVIELRRNEWERRRASDSVSDKTFKSNAAGAIANVRYINNLGSRTSAASGGYPDTSVRVSRNRSLSGSGGAPPLSDLGRSGSIGSSSNSSIAPTLSPTFAGSGNLGVSRGSVSVGTPPPGSKSNSSRVPNSSSPFPGAESAAWRGPGETPVSASEAVDGISSTPTVVRKRTPAEVSGLIDEYLSFGPDQPESEGTVEELKLCAGTDLITCILQKILEAKSSDAVGLLNLAGELSPCLSSHVEDGLRSSEALQLLADTVVDYKQVFS
jgi:hypothetical protein